MAKADTSDLPAETAEAAISRARQEWFASLTRDEQGREAVRLHDAIMSLGMKQHGKS